MFFNLDVNGLLPTLRDIWSSVETAGRDIPENIMIPSAIQDLWVGPKILHMSSEHSWPTKRMDVSIRDDMYAAISEFVCAEEVDVGLLWGLAASSKTTLVVHAMREQDASKQIILYIDASEFESKRRPGVDCSAWFYNDKFGTLKKKDLWDNHIVHKLSSNQKCLIVLDHFDSLLCASESSDISNPKDDIFKAGDLLSKLADECFVSEGRLRIMLVADRTKTLQWFQRQTRHSVHVIGGFDICRWTMEDAKKILDLSDLSDDLKQERLGWVARSRGGCNFTSIRHLKEKMRREDDMVNEMTQIADTWDVTTRIAATNLGNVQVQHARLDTTCFFPVQVKQGSCR